MHGVGETLEGLSDFVGLRLVAVDDLDSIVYFRFAGAAEEKCDIGVESEWIIRDASGAIVASGQPSPNEPIAEPPLQSVVTAAETQPPDSILLTFASGHTLQVVDNTDHTSRSASRTHTCTSDGHVAPMRPVVPALRRPPRLTASSITLKAK